MADIPSTLELAARILLAFLLGGVVGIEREVDDHPAGLRTHIAVCVGAALFGIVSAYGFTEFGDVPRDRSSYQVDVTRIASQVVSGMGFLGGGAILKYGATVKGLTTAASMWVTAAIGLAVAFGEYPIALVSTAVILASLVVLKLPERVFGRRSHKREIIVRVARGSGPSAIVRALAQVPGADEASLHVDKTSGETTVTVRARLREDALRDVVGSLADRSDVDTVELG